MEFGVELACKIARKISDTTDKVGVKELLQAWIKNISGLKNRICISSFSADGDSLSQWRAYGPIAVGFKPHSLVSSVNDGRLQKVEYEVDVQEKLIEIYLDHLCQAFLVDVAENRLERSPDIYQKTERLLEIIAFFKDPSFKIEEEYRLVYFENPDVLEMLGEDKPPKHFRISKSRLYPYISSDEIFSSHGNDYPLQIAEVVLGPESDDLLERGVREYMLSLDLGNVPIRRSVIPYRT